RPIVVVVGDGGPADGAHHGEVMFRAREDDVQPLLSARLVDRAEVHQHAPVPIWAVADADDDDVTLVPLDVFEILDEQSNVLAVFFALELRFVARTEFRILCGKVAYRGLN